MSVYKKIFFSGFRNAFHLLTGNVLSQIISLIALIYITRNLGPERFGTYSLVLSFVTIFAFLNLPGIDRVLMIEGSRRIEKIPELVSESFNVKVLSSFLSVLVVILFSLFTPYDKEIILLIILFSTSLFFTGFLGYFTSIFQSHERMEFISMFRISRTSFFALGSVCLIYLGFGVLHLIALALCSFAISSFFHHHYAKTLSDYKISIIKPISYPRFREALTYSAISMVGLAAGKIEILILSVLTNTYEIGLFVVPLSLVNRSVILRNALSVGFGPTIIKNLESFNWFKVFFASFVVLLFVGTGCLFVNFFSEDIVVFLLGSQYIESYLLLEVMVFSVAFSFATIPYVLILQATNNSNAILLSSFFSLIIQVPLTFLMYNNYGLIGIAYSSLIAYFLVWFFMVTYGSYVIHTNVHRKAFNSQG